MNYVNYLLLLLLLLVTMASCNMQEREIRSLQYQLDRIERATTNIENTTRSLEYKVERVDRIEEQNERILSKIRGF